MLWGYEVRQLSDNYSQQYEINLQHSMVHYRYVCPSPRNTMEFLILVSFFLLLLLPPSCCYFSSYSHAHTYYLKYDVGCTLLLILTEMCEMYLHSFQLHEITLNNEIKNIKNIKDQNKNHNLSHSSELITSSLIFIHQLISSLLGGAYRVLIDCRFALTGIVLERYGQVMLENGLIETIIRLLKILLLKLLKYLSFLLPLYDAKGEESNDDQRTVTSTSTSVTTIQLLKEIYSNLLKTTNWKYQSTQINSCGSSSSGGGGGERSVASSSSAGGGGSSSSGSGDSEKDIKYLYEILEKLNSCEWLKANL